MKIRRSLTRDHAPGATTPSGERRPRHSGGALCVESLRVETRHGVPIVQDIDMALAAGEILGIVGESGCGKTTTARALLGYAADGAVIAAGSVAVGGEPIVGATAADARRMRGSLISYVPQNPAAALNPAMRVGDAVAYMLRTHGRSSSPEAVSSAFTMVQLPCEPSFLRRYPHQLSGGQRQRVCIAIALVCEPRVVVLDEPTTGLDVVTQGKILDELLRLRHEQGVSMVYVTHDLAAVAPVADRIAVMYAGRIVEIGPAARILRRPRHPYTRGLISSTPDHLTDRALRPLKGVAPAPGDRPTACAFAPRCELRTPACEAAVPPLRDLDGRGVRCIRAEQVDPLGWSVHERSREESSLAEEVLSVSRLTAEYKSRQVDLVVADEISFTLDRGQAVALVGESGSGKTTIARCVAGLHAATAGEIRLGDQLLPGLAKDRTREHRRQVQMIFQDPADALNPQHSVRTTIARSARVLRGLSRAAAEAEVQDLLELVRLPRRVAGRYPRELSGGERQRVAIARALIAKPDVLVCDEITSALDVSVQAAVLELLRGLKRELGLSLLFITHDFGVVAAVADDVLVLDRGRICEAGPVSEVLHDPQGAYTRELLAAAPSISQAVSESADSTPSPSGRGVDGGPPPSVTAGPDRQGGG